MALSQRLDLRQSQSLVMTPQLQQAIKLLQLSNIELSRFVEQELERNPLLESQDTAPQPPERMALEAPEDPQERAALQAQDRKDSAELTGSDHLPASQDNPLDSSPDDFGNVYTEESPSDGAASAHDRQSDGGGDGLSTWNTASGSGGGRSDFGDDDRSLEERLAEEISLRDHLLEQLMVDQPDPAHRIIGLHLIDMLDATGYLVGDLQEVADKLGCPLSLVEDILSSMQRYDPAGIFARSLKECLALQLLELNRYDPAMEALLENLELLAKHDLASLLKICGVDREDLMDMVSEIRALDPKPALRFYHEPLQTVVPDILMGPKSEAEWRIELNPETLPKVLVNADYYTQVTRGARNKEEKEYLSEAFNSANWLVKSLHQRATTILKVAAEIVRQQDAFFIHGVQYLRPLVLRDIAEVIGMHESTISRVTTNKFIATPRGIYELKYFFTAAIQSAHGGSSHSAESVRHRIKTLIDEEPPKKILSDDRIVEILKSEGIDIARRTVAKYREALKIPSSVQRRRQKNAKL